MPIIENPCLKDYTYYATGGRCEVLHAPATIAELAMIVKDLHHSGKKYFLLGGGTNSLVMDDDYPGAVIIFKKLNSFSVKDTVISVGAGVENSDLARRALKANLGGAAWMYRLPGQLGGTVRMNARCYGGEISQIARRIEVVTSAGEIKSYGPDKMEAIFRGYKDTSFMTNGELIAGVELQLHAADAQAIEATMQHCERDRESKGQFDFPSCGCVFKNNYDVGVSSGVLLDAAGAKALKKGGAEVSPHHANFVYNKGASSRAIIELSLLMRELVYEKFGAWLEYEMEILGELPADLQAKVAQIKPHRLQEAALAALRSRMTAKL